MTQPCLKEYLKCLKEQKPTLWELQCADKIFLCLKKKTLISK